MSQNNDQEPRRTGPGAEAAARTRAGREPGDAGDARQADRRGGRRTGRPDGGLSAREEGAPGGRARGRGPGRRDRQDGGPRRLPLRPRRPPLLHQGQGGRRALARDHEGGVPGAPAHVADLLEQEVPRLPAARHRRDQEARSRRAHAGVPLLPLGAGQAEGARGHLRAVGVQPLRQAPVQPLLQVLHGEGVGRPDLRDPGGVGGPAHQGPVVLQRGQVRLLRQPRQQAHEPDRQVQLPALRARSDVGADDRGHRDARRQGAAQPARHEARVRRQPLREGPHRQGRGLRAVGRDLVAAAAQHGRDGRIRTPSPR